MQSNGITTAALSLRENLDVETLDTTVLLGVPQDEDQAATAALVPARHRQLFRIAPTPPALGRYLAQLVSVRFGGQVPARVRRSAEAALGEEWRRIGGGARFDVVVDFSGYSGFWTMLLARVPCGSRAVWMHNDLAADQRKRVGRSRPHGRTLATVFSTYGEYDHLVSVSPALREINARMLSAFAPAERFTAARNTIDARRVVQGAAVDERVVPPPPAGSRQIVTVGRLAPEKNHARLVRAFARVHAEDPATRLVIVGSGPLTGQVQRLVEELGLADAVTITGLVRNPWRIMADSHVFTLSSDFEGQPMVVLEARILGLPIVSTAFGSVRDSLEEGVGLVVERTDSALADGLRRALAGEVPAPAFDVDAYNALVVGEFVRAVGLG
jgi:glycosyltransferase involved in cell wall biosynthesis